MKNYPQYLTSKKWKSKRQEILSKQSCCGFCFSQKNIHIHHKSYKSTDGHSVLGKEPHKYLIPLCASCHRKWHFYHKDRFLRKQMIRRANNMFLEGIPVDDCIRFCFDRYLYKHIIINWKKDRDKIERNKSDNSAVKASSGNMESIRGYVSKNDKKLY